MSIVITNTTLTNQKQYTEWLYVGSFVPVSEILKQLVCETRGNRTAEFKYQLDLILCSSVRWGAVSCESDDSGDLR